jgi:hypothetical protein
MTFEIKKDDYILGFWSAGDGDGNTWHCICLKSKNGNEWLGRYTFRYKRDDKIFDSDDEKSSYKFKGPLISEEEQIIKMDKFASFVHQKYNVGKEREIIKGDVDKFLKFAVRSKNLHLKMVPNNEDKQ